MRGLLAFRKNPSGRLEGKGEGEEDEDEDEARASGMCLRINLATCLRSNCF